MLSKNIFIINSLIHILQYNMSDLEVDESGMGWIEYFCFELDFGKNSNRLKVTKNGVKIPMSNAAELYNFLIQNNV